MCDYAGSKTNTSGRSHWQALVCHNRRMNQPARDIQQAELPNGLVIVTEKMPHVRSVSVGIWLGTGSRAETSGRNGIAHFIEHMLFKGTRKRTAEQIAQSMDSVGGMLDAFTGKEMTCFNAKVLDEHLPVAVDVLSDLVLRPRFDAEDIAKEKQVVLEEIKMEEDNPEYLIHELFTQNFWRGHPLAMPILGSPETVSQFSRDAVSQCFKEWYAPNRVVITAAGNLEHARLVDLVAREFEGAERSATAAKPTPPETHACVEQRDKKELEQVHIVAGCAVVSSGARTALRGVALERNLGRRYVLAAVSEYSRAPGPGLRDRERPLAVHRFGRAFRVCGNFAGIRGEADSFGVR